MGSEPKEGAVCTSNTTVYRWNPQIASRTVSGSAFVLLNSRMLSLNSVATRMWERFRDGATVDDVVQGIVVEFDATEAVVRKDTNGLVDQLIERDLLVASTAEGETTQAKASLDNSNIVGGKHR